MPKKANKYYLHRKAYILFVFYIFAALKELEHDDYE
jgi:hypothetical protein